MATIEFITELNPAVFSSTWNSPFFKIPLLVSISLLIIKSNWPRPVHKSKFFIEKFSKESSNEKEKTLALVFEASSLISGLSKFKTAI